MSDAPNFKVVSDDEAEKAEYVLCIRKTENQHFDDNEECPCCKCGETVVFRPYMPKKPKRICIQCMLDQVKAEKVTE